MRPPLEIEQGRHLLRRFRKRAGLRQADLAGHGISASYISALERGERRRPSREVLDKLATRLKLSQGERFSLINAFFPALDLSTLPAGADQLQQLEEDVESVWVVSEEPAEVDDSDYRNVFEANLTRGVTYTYWTMNPIWFRRLRERISGDALELFQRQVECVLVPEEANWLSFVVYDPLSPDQNDQKRQPWGRIALYGQGTRLSHTMPMDNKSLDRVLGTLVGVYNYLKEEMKQEDVRESGGYKWHFPIP